MLFLITIFVLFNCANNSESEITENEAIISAYDVFSEEYRDMEANSVVVEVLNGSERLKNESSGVWYICFHRVAKEKHEINYTDYLYLVNKSNGESVTPIDTENIESYINYEAEVSQGIDRGIKVLYGYLDYNSIVEEIDTCCLIKLEWTEDENYWREKFSYFCTEDNENHTNEETISIPKYPDVHAGIESSKLTINGEDAEFLFYTQGGELIARICEPKNVYPIAYTSNSTNYSVVIEFSKPIPIRYENIKINKINANGEWKNYGSLPNDKITKAELKENKFYLEFSLDEAVDKDIFYTIEIDFCYYMLYYAQLAHFDFAIKSPSAENIPVLSEKSGNQVYFAFEEKKDYYTEIKNYVEITDCFEMPRDENGNIKEGVYFKVIPTYEELLTYIEAPDLDSSVFNSSYVVCVKQYFDIDKTIVGYYNFKQHGNDMYDISLDYFESVGQGIKEYDVGVDIFTNYILIPKHVIEYTDQVKQISVNGKDYIEVEIFIDEDGQPNIKEEYIKHRYISYNTNATLPKNPASWVIKEDSELEKSFGLEYYDKYSETEYRVVLYLPNEPECDFIITNEEIKNGNLYLTVEAYTQYTNEYLNKNDVKFYDLNIADSSELNENYDVYITVLEKSAPVINAINPVSEKKAFMIAQKHFYETYGEELTENYCVIELTSVIAEFNASESEAWYCLFAPSNSNSSGKQYWYYISKKTGEILNILIFP